MEIAIIADDSKKEMVTQFCIAYYGILSKHTLSATSTTGQFIEEATGLEVKKLLCGELGGVQQITSRIQYEEIDMVFYFRGNEVRHPGGQIYSDAAQNIMRVCDVHNIPFATNLATAEALISALDRGDFDYRNYINPRSEYSMTHREHPEAFLPI